MVICGCDVVRVGCDVVICGLNVFFFSFIVRRVFFFKFPPYIWT